MARSSRDSRVGLPLLIGLVLLCQVLVAADEPKLEPGVELPTLESKTLSGDPAVLPRDAAGHPAVLIIGFSKAAAKITRAWLENCLAAAASRPGGSSLYCYDIRMLEDVPKSFRGMVERSMRSGYPAELQRRALLVYTGNDAWRQRVGVADDKTAYVIGCDKDGRVRKTVSGQFGDAVLKSLLEAIDPSPVH